MLAATRTAGTRLWRSRLRPLGGSYVDQSSFGTTTTTTATGPSTLFLNCSRLDYDEALNFENLSKLTQFHRNNVDKISGDNPTERIVRMVNDLQTEILILKEIPLPSDAVKDFGPHLKLICEAGTGYNNIPIEACQSKNITVCNIPTYSTDAVAQTAITYVMNFAMNMFRQQEMLRDNDRSNFNGPFTLPLMELNGKTLGLVGGAGTIGSKVAEIALVLGMKVIISRRPSSGALPDSHPLANHPNVTVTYEVDDLLHQSDFVSIHTPLNAHTEGSFGRAQISQMKPTAYLINTSRGRVCNEEEVIDCLEEGLIAGAGLDVTKTEPPSEDSRLWSLKNAWLSPHIGWRRLETRQRLVDMTCDNVQAYLEGTPINVVS